MSGAIVRRRLGNGTMNVTAGGTVASSDGFIGVNPGSSGQVTVSGANSTWANSNSLFVGNGGLDVNDGGVVSVMGVLQVNRWPARRKRTNPGQRPKLGPGRARDFIPNFSGNASHRWQLRAVGGRTVCRARRRR